MGNTNDTNNNFRNDREKDSDNNKEPGFFDNFICCGQANPKFELNSKADTLRPEFIWFYESEWDKEKSKKFEGEPSDGKEQEKIIWIPYSIEINQLIEKAFISNTPSLKINFGEDKEESYQINFSDMMQIKTSGKKNYSYQNFSLQNSSYSQPRNFSSYTKIKRFNRNDVNKILKKTSFDNIAFLEKLNFIKEYNNTHNIQKPVKILTLFKVLAFPIRCLDIFNSTIYLLPEWISILKNNFKNSRINSFPHLKQLLTEEITLEANKLSGKDSMRNAIEEKKINESSVYDLANNSNNNNKNNNNDVNKSEIISPSVNYPLDNYLLQAEIYNDIIENHMNQDNFEMIIIYLFNLEGFIQERINFILMSNAIEFSNLKLYFLLLQSAIKKDNQNQTVDFLKNNNLIKEDSQSGRKMLKLYKGCYLNSETLRNYLNLFRNNNMRKSLDEEEISKLKNKKIK